VPSVRTSPEDGHFASTVGDSQKVVERGNSSVAVVKFRNEGHVTRLPIAELRKEGKTSTSGIPRAEKLGDKNRKGKESP